METIAEIFESTAYFLFNPIAWFAAIAMAQRTGILYKPVIAAIGTQWLICGLLIALVALSNRPFPADYIIFLLLIPGALSGAVLSVPVLMVTKRRRLKRFLGVGQPDNARYAKQAAG